VRPLDQDQKVPRSYHSRFQVQILLTAKKSKKKNLEELRTRACFVSFVTKRRIDIFALCFLAMLRFRF